MKIAAIDIGTNSVHMIVVRVRPDFSFEVIDREKVMVRLGAGGLDGRALTPTAMNAALQALAQFKRLADSYGVDDIIAAATSATREAENGGDFLNMIAEQTEIRANVISGTEEARLIHIAAGYGIDLGGGLGVVIDIGGGSTEITLGPATDATLARSFKIGVIRLTERFVKTDPLEAADEQRLVRYIRRQVGSHVEQILKQRFVRVVGTSGTILSLGMLAASEDGVAPGEVRNLRVPARGLHKLRKKLISMNQRQRLQFPGLDPRRADLSVAGAVLIDTLIQMLGVNEFYLCDLALREGLVLDYIGRNKSQIAHVDHYPDIRRRSVMELAERCHFSPEHARQVARIALTLFDATRGIHGLGDREREWLEYGATLHDIGVLISYSGHHKHSHYLVKNGDLRGFSPEEVEVIALITRYHRRGQPRKSEAGFAALPRALRRTVRMLSAFTALAEGLDRSHAQVASGVSVEDRGRDLVVHIDADADAELEVWAANRNLTPLEKVLERTVRLETNRRPTRTVSTGRAASTS